METGTTGTRREFCTRVHRFAQGCEQNLIDGMNGKLYLAFQIESGKLEAFKVQFGGRDQPNGVTPSSGFGEVRNFTGRSRGRSSRKAVAPRDWTGEGEALRSLFG